MHQYRYHFWRFLFITGSLSANIISGQTQSPDSLFTHNSVTLSQEQETTLTNLEALATTDGMRLTNINFDIFNRNTISLNLFPGRVIDVSKKKIKIRDANTYTWFGDYINNTGSVALVVRNNNITATIHINKEIYTIRPIGSGIHVIIHVDWSKFPPDHPPEDSKNQPPGEPLQNNSFDSGINEVDKSNRLGKTLVGSDDTIKVFVSYTPAAESAYGGDIAAPNAYSINLLYNEFWLPDGGRLFIYNDDRSMVLGAFTSANNKDHGKFATGPVRGDTSILEYYEPTYVEMRGVVL